MSAHVPAPLYAYSRISGFRPIDPEPKEPTSKKYGGGLVGKLDRLLHRTSATHIPPHPSTRPPLKDPATANEHRSDGSRDPIPLRILTWNIWFENLLKKQRTSALIATVKSLNPLPDVCCFQECTAGFELQLEEDNWWRKTWAMTKCADQFAVTGFRYGTMVFVRKELVGRMEFKAKAWFEPFRVSQTGRGLLILELTPPGSKHPVQRYQFFRSVCSLTCWKLLSTPVLNCYLTHGLHSSDPCEPVRLNYIRPLGDASKRVLW